MTNMKVRDMDQDGGEPYYNLNIFQKEHVRISSRQAIFIAYLYVV